MLVRNWSDKMNRFGDMTVSIAFIFLILFVGIYLGTKSVKIDNCVYDRASELYICSVEPKLGADK